jgi:hypothetical protein
LEQIARGEGVVIIGQITRKDGHASRYHPLQELAKDSIQTLILEDVFKLADELPQPGEEEGIECGIHRFKLDRSSAFCRCRHETTSF